MLGGTAGESEDAAPDDGRTAVGRPRRLDLPAEQRGE